MHIALRVSYERFWSIEEEKNSKRWLQTVRIAKRGVPHTQYWDYPQLQKFDRVDVVATPPPKSEETPCKAPTTTTTRPCKGSDMDYDTDDDAVQGPWQEMQQS
jgi:hypothetical protein